MNLQLLRTSPHVAIYYDSWNDWLFVDWEGELTLSAVQSTCLDLAHCFLARSYTRVLNSNTRVTNVSWDIPTWLVHHFLPHLSLAGVEQLAWVCAPTLRGQGVVNEIVSRLPTLAISLFDDLDLAVAWLQKTRTDYPTGCALLPRPSTVQSQLTKLIQAFSNTLKYPAIYSTKLVEK